VTGPRTLRLDLEFDGAAFSGWQRQKDRRSVQGVVEEALSRLLGAPTAVVGAGRTDAGVHARRMVASCRTASAMPAATVARALDATLPEDVGVLAVADAAASFHARRDARWKWYRYTVLRGRARRVFERRTSWRVAAPLDLPRMREAAAVLVGRLDFAAFQSAGSPRRSTVRTVHALRWEEEGPRLHLDAVADGFLYGMVRAIAGTLVEAGRGSRDAAAVAALVASRDRARAGAAAPPHALCLMDVGYADEPAPFVAPPRSAAVGSRARSSLPTPSED
jgi:tRNA pseudouridine38-40 synthase